MDTEVLIVGAGPTGLMLANQLARRGVRVMIIDRHSGPAQQSRAMAVQARTLEIYAQLGITEQALALGARATGANLWANGKWAARIPIGDIGTGMSPFPFILTLGQDDNERIMGARLSEHGVAVQWNTELVTFEQQAGHVDVTLRQADGSTRSIRAAWVAGCDGSRSPVREMSGITFPGAPYQHTFFVADTEAAGPMKAGELNVYLWRDGFHLFFPMRGKDRWRVIGIIPRQLRDRKDIVFDDLIPEIRREAGSDLIFSECSWFSVYRIHHRAAERFRDRRVFLLGDAAHIHSPAGGQGMNTGLQDAYNLAWKLALVVKGDAAPSLLDTYEPERLRVAQRLLRTTDRIFQIIVADGWFGTLFRTRIMARAAAFAMTIDRARRFLFRTISQIGIRYRKSLLSRSLVAMPQGAPAAGDRFPWGQLRLQAGGPAEDLFQALDDTRFNLLVIGQPDPGPRVLTDLLRIVVIPTDTGNKGELRRMGVPERCCYLLRPDGHVALASTRLDMAAVSRYFSDIGIQMPESQRDGPAARRDLSPA